MLICHRYKFIFIKTRKTAGTSIEIALSEFCDQNDIITPIFDQDEKLRKELGYTSAQNYEIPYNNYAAKDWLRLAIFQQKALYSNHMKARQVCSRIDSKIWNNYFKFCFERNPWDKAISWYYWLTRDINPKPSFGDFIKSLDNYKISNFDVYSRDNQIIVDRVGRFECLQDELEDIAKHLGLPHSLKLPKAKGGYRQKNKRYQEIIDAPEKELIEKICSREIEHFNYKF